MDNFETKKKSITNLLLEVEKEFGTDVPISTVDILLMIPLTGSVPVTKIRAMSSLTEAGVSRVLSTLNAHNVANRRVLDKLVEIFIDDVDRRYRHVKLTKRGKEVVTRFMSYVCVNENENENENGNESNQPLGMEIDHIEHNFAFNRG